MNDSSGLMSQDEASPPHEQLGACLKNLFSIPSKNVELAFQLILGMIREQSSQIECLKQANAEALESNAMVCSSMQNAIDNLTRENHELSGDFEVVKRHHHEILKSHSEAMHAVAGLRNDFEMLTFNCFGETAECQDDKNEAEQLTGPENTGLENTHDDKTCSKCKANTALGWGTIGRIGLAKVKFVKEKLNANQIVTARLDQLEQSLSNLASSLRQVNGQSSETNSPHEKFEEMFIRIHAVETFLHGFDPLQPLKEAKNDSNHSVVESSATETAEQNDEIDQYNFVEKEGTPDRQTPISHRGTLLLHLNEREMKTGLTIDELTQQMSDLRQTMQKQQPSLQHVVDARKLQQEFTQLTGELRQKIAELEFSVRNKVSAEDFETKIQDMHSIFSSCNACETADPSRNLHSITNNELNIVKRHAMEQVSKLENSKLDKEDFEQQLEQMECDLKSLFEQELLKQQLDISDNAEKTENELMEIRSIIDSHHNSILRLSDETPIASDIDASKKEDEIYAKIQQATDDVRESLEERLHKLSSIESEVDGFASKMAEKPSQDQIEFMLHDLEKRLGKDEALQIILANMKKDLKQRMTRGQVITLVRHTLKEAKLGIENTKDNAMVGRIPYCLGCSKPCPAGVNGIRAPKMNHDSLPPALGLVSNATLYGAGNRKNLRPLQMLRSAPPPRPRPKSAILGRFSASSAYVRVRNNSR